MKEGFETTAHPTLGTLKWLPDDSQWHAQYRLPSGRPLDVVVGPGDQDRHEFIEPAARLFRWAIDNERRVLGDAVRAELLDLYNETWRQDDEPELTADELAARLTWELLAISASDVAPIEFGYEAGELFGRHSVTVEVSEELEFQDVDLRG